MLKKRYIIIALLIALLMPTIYRQLQPTQNIDGITVQGRIHDSEQLKEVITVLQANNAAVNAHDLERYLNTLIPEARLETREALEASFASSTLTVTIEGVRIARERSSEWTLRVDVLVESTDANYKPHREEQLITFVEIDGQWLIAEAIVSKSRFI